MKEVASGTTDLTRRSWPRWWNWALPGWPWPAARWFPWWWMCPWWAGEWSWQAEAGSVPVAAGRRASGGLAATGSEPWEALKGWGSPREEQRGSRRGAGSSMACWWVWGWMALGSPILRGESGWKQTKQLRRQRGILFRQVTDTFKNTHYVGEGSRFFNTWTHPTRYESQSKPMFERERKRKRQREGKGRLTTARSASWSF